jgi:hypothetical protein
LYWATALSAIWYPGAMWIDPEFGEGRPQFYVFSIHLALVWLGYSLETRRLASPKKSKTRKA